MITNEIVWKTIQPPKELQDFVESIWMLTNLDDNEHRMVIFPDGSFDIIFSLSNNKNFKATLRGLDTEPSQTILLGNSILFGISFKLLAIEYLLEEKVGSLLNKGVRLSDDFWDIGKNDFENFDTFCKKVSYKMMALIKPQIDNKKLQLFDLIYTSNGTLTVKELAQKVFWSSRQINRYFNQTVGISLKAYCNVFRFRSSLNHIKNGKLYPELNFTDQSHFIKEVKKMSGVTPKELFKNKNDRFILLNAFPEN